MKRIGLGIALHLGLIPLSIVAVFVLGIGNGWEVIALAVAALFAAYLPGRLVVPQVDRRSLLTAAMGAVLGGILLLSPGASFGYGGLLLPFVGALAGFYVGTLLLLRE